jgi:anti-sigma factor RsiW
MSEQPANVDASLEEQLVAYLDGELDTAASRRIEELLADDPKVRLTLQRLDRTWQLLGALDATPVDERFIQSTLEMVTVAAVEEVEQSRAQAPRRRRRRWLLTAASVAAAGLAGFLIVGRMVPDPNQELIEELPVLENLDQYSQVGDVEFLQMLCQEGLFAKESDDGR